MSDTVPVVFRNVGQYPITIGRRVVAPGDALQWPVRRDDLPQWDCSVVEVSLAQPEAEGVEDRNPLGLIERAAPKS